MSKDTEFCGEFCNFRETFSNLFLLFFRFLNVAVRLFGRCSSFNFCNDKKKLFEKQRR